jgi:hypothetical protein
VRSNQQFVNPGANFMLLNGMLVEVKNFEIYSTSFSILAEHIPVTSAWQLYCFGMTAMHTQHRHGTGADAALLL